MNEVCIVGSLDNPRSRHMRLLEEASKLGPVHVLLLSDQLVAHLTGNPPVFPHDERRYFAQAIRYVHQVSTVEQWDDRNTLPDSVTHRGATWVVDESEDWDARRAFCEAHDMSYLVMTDDRLIGFPYATQRPSTSTSIAESRNKVLVTGCYDWLHTGHISFFEEVAELGELYVVLGHDANITSLKGPGHPLFGQEERRYMVGAIRHVHEARIATGSGWLDAESEIREIRPDIYVVNEDGNRKEKLDYCHAHGIDYRILTRAPRQGLPRRQSTALRGF